MGLLEDARNIQRKDPAARSVLEVILLYPGFHILVYHRIAHWLYQHKRFFLARWVSQHGRRRTGIEIHPGATIGRCLFIDHGMGIVFGETCEIGDNCTIYTRDAGRHRQGHRQAPPHPGEQCADRRGHQGAGPGVYRRYARIGAGSVVLRNLPANCTAVGVPARWCASTTRPSTPPTTWTSRICRMSWPSASPSWTAASAGWKRTRRGMCPPASTRSSRNSSAEPLGPTLRASFPHRGAAGMAVLSAKTAQSFCKTKAAALRTHGTQLLFCYLQGFSASSLTFCAAAATSWPMGWSGTPTTMFSQWLMGTSTRRAGLWQTAAAMAG